MPKWRQKHGHNGDKVRNSKRRQEISTRLPNIGRRRHKIGHEDFTPIFLNVSFKSFLPRDAMLSVVYAVVVLCVSVTLRYCIKTAKHRITQIMPHDSPETLVFWYRRSQQNLDWITPYWGNKCKWGRLKLATFDEKLAITNGTR